MRFGRLGLDLMIRQITDKRMDEEPLSLRLAHEILARKFDGGFRSLAVINPLRHTTIYQCVCTHRIVSLLEHMLPACVCRV